MSPSNITFSDKTLRWMVYSFQPADVESVKNKMNIVLKQMLWKRVMDKEVIPRLAHGTRLVVEDFEGFCSNCYHYGPWPASGSRGGFCANHAYHEEETKVWITWKQFKKYSRSSFRYEEYEDYWADVKEEMQKREEEMARYEEECERAMRAYFNRA